MLIYDGDCGFCTSSANWFAERADDRARIAPWQSLDLDEIGLTEQQASTAVWWHANGELSRGADAAAAAMKTCPNAWRFAGHLLALPGIIHVGRALYPIIARNRYRLPGSTDACAL